MHLKSKYMKIRNPYNAIPEHHCFGCAKRNPIGLKLDFEKTEDEVVAKWNPTTDYQGFGDFLHGGIAATLLDEIAFWAVQAFLDSSGVTSELSVKYLKPVHISYGEITVKAKLRGQAEKHKYAFETQLFDGKGMLCVEAIATYFVYPQEMAKAKFMYPGKEALGL